MEVTNINENLNLTIVQPTSETLVPTFSKRQLKKLKKLQDWEHKKKEKRLKEREKYRLKRLEALESGRPTRTGPSRKELKRNKINADVSKFTVAIDLSFDELMIDKDISKCVKQLLRVYTINRRSKIPINVYFTNLQIDNRLYRSLEKNDGYKNWDVKMEFESFENIFDTNKIIYLTSDSENILEVLEEDKIYVIGGLVDHNHNKGHCLKVAEDKKIKHARLPLNENLIIKTRTVLSIFHVFEILLRKSQGENWQEALMNVLPSRKGAQPKQIECESNNNSSEDDEEPPQSQDFNHIEKGYSDDEIINKNGENIPIIVEHEDPKS